MAMLQKCHKIGPTFFNCPLLKYFLKCFFSKNNMKSATLLFKIIVIPSPIILCKPKSRTFNSHSLPFISGYVYTLNLDCYRCQNSTVSTCQLDLWFSDVNVFLTLFIVCLTLTLDSVTEMPQKCIICLYFSFRKTFFEFLLNEIKYHIILSKTVVIICFCGVVHVEY